MRRRRRRGVQLLVWNKQQGEIILSDVNHEKHRAAAVSILRSKDYLLKFENV